jgi:hypothetical protein
MLNPVPPEALNPLFGQMWTRDLGTVPVFDRICRLEMH